MEGFALPSGEGTCCFFSGVYLSAVRMVCMCVCVRVSLSLSLTPMTLFSPFAGGLLDQLCPHFLFASVAGLHLFSLPTCANRRLSHFPPSLFFASRACACCGAPLLLFAL